MHLTRKISQELRPSILDDLGLIPAIDWLKEQYNQRSDIHFTMDMPKNEINIENDCSTAIFRITQEALTNIMRHAAAKNVNIKILVGEVLGQSSFVNTYSPVSIFDTQFTKPNELSLSIPCQQMAMIYIIEGELKLKDTDIRATKGQMVYFDQSSDILYFHSLSQSGSYLVLAGQPLNEPIARYGPFVANTEGEVKQAMLNYQSGKMGQMS